LAGGGVEGVDGMMPAQPARFQSPRGGVPLDPRPTISPRTIVTVLRREIGAREALLLISLALIAFGFWLFWRPGAFLAPGVVLLWLAVASNAAFVLRPDTDGPPRKPRAGA
jgi:hypothetical protein